ncbi:MAG TPA: hypothetical protein PK950_00755 [Candidatus Paceibacterota bacterium]|nr:hypothetical protein [Candidatus Paceibacterota bacterium]
MAPTNNQRKLPILIIIFLFLVAAAVSMIETRNASQQAAVISSKTTDSIIAESVKSGRASIVMVDEKTNAALRDAVAIAFNQAGVLPNSYMYYCRNNGESTGTLYSTEINQPWIITESSICVQVGY